MINKEDKKILGLNRRQKGSTRALVLFGFSAAFVIGALWYTAIMGDAGGPRNTASLPPAATSVTP
jgi:hypothetical protein